MKTTSLKLALAGLLVAGVSAQATDLNLTAGGSGFINTAFFTTTLQQSTGTGVIDPFVRVVDPQAPADGYNINVSQATMSDVNTSPQFTHDLLLSSVPIQTIGGVAYYEFLLDINQTGANPLLSLDKIQIYTRGSALTTAGVDLSGNQASDDANLLAHLVANSTLRYNLDAGGDNRILLNYDLNSGSGSGDMLAYIPVSLFGAETDYVYFYSQFGSSGEPYTENDGFEEWAIKERGTTTNVPEGGATVLLLGVALTALGAGRRFLKL